MKNIKIPYIIGAVILIAGIISSAVVMRQPDSNTVVISRDGDILYKINLNNYDKAETIEVSYGDEKNTVLIENGTICISYADCPDQTCVKMGRLRSSAPIVCLPHHLVIQYTNDSNASLDGTVY